MSKNPSYAELVAKVQELENILDWAKENLDPVPRKLLELMRTGWIETVEIGFADGPTEKKIKVTVNKLRGCCQGEENEV